MLETCIFQNISIEQGFLSALYLKFSCCLLKGKRHQSATILKVRSRTSKDIPNLNISFLARFVFDHSDFSKKKKKKMNRCILKRILLIFPKYTAFKISIGRFNGGLKQREKKKNGATTSSKTV